MFIQIIDQWASTGIERPPLQAIRRQAYFVSRKNVDAPHRQILIKTAKPSLTRSIAASALWEREDSVIDFLYNYLI